MPRFAKAFSLACFILADTATAAAPERFRASYAADGAITGGTLLVGALFSLVDVDTQSRWDSELLALDEGVKRNFSISAAGISDALTLGVVVTPLATQLGQGVDERMAQASLLYGQALGLNFLLNSASKYLVQRPRPYNYSDDPGVRTYAKAQGKDSHLSFYSGHASTSFAAAVAGSYLFALSSHDKTARAWLWGAELALATATTNMRVRAGKHYYSDVVLGAVVGAAIGALVPLAHERDGVRYRPSGREWVAMAGGVASGALVSALWPLPRDVTSSVEQPDTMTLTPTASADGLGVMFSGRL